MVDSTLDFFHEKPADDIVYALSHPEYFGLTTDQSTELHGLVFSAIKVAQQ